MNKNIIKIDNYLYYLDENSNINIYDWFVLQLPIQGIHIRQLVSSMEESDNIKTHLTDWVLIGGSKKIIGSTNPLIKLPIPYEILDEYTDEPTNIKIISITLLEYKELIHDSKKLRALEHTGVDNWEGYDMAMDRLEQMDNE